MNRISMKHICLAICFVISTAICQITSPYAHQKKFDYEYEEYKNHKRWIPPSSPKFESDSILTLIGRWAWGPCLTVDVKDNYAFIGNGPTFHVLDISNPLCPTIIGEYITDGYVFDIRLKDSLAFIAVGNALLILDVTNPQMPHKVSDVKRDQVTLPYIHKVAVVDSFAYVGGFPGGVFVIDISNIYSPRVRGRFYPGGEWAEGFTAVGRLIFWGGFESGDLIVIDATNPDTLQFYCSIGNDFCFPTAIYDKDSLLYVGTSCGYGGIASNAIEIIKIVSRDSSILLGKVDIDHYVGSITVEGATMYAVSDSGVVYSIDITDLTNPTIIFRCSPTAWGNTFPVHSVIKKTGEYLLVAERSGLSIINARKPEKLHRVSFFPTGGKVTKIVIKDNLAFIASYYSGLWILDISNPQKIKNISNVNVGARTVDVVVKDNLAYFVNFTYRENDTSRGLWIVDISDIYHPKILGHHIGIVRDPPSWDHHNAISRIDNYVVIAQVGGTTYDSTLEVVDVSNPLKPRNVSIIRSASLPYRIAIKDSILYVADAKLGLRIIDLHDPSNPKQLSLIKGRGRGIGLKDTLAFMFNPYLAVVNISDPHFPFVLYTSSIPPSDFNSIDMAVEGSFLYYAGTRNGGIVDISNPLNPVLKDTFRPKDRTFAVAAKGDTVYLSDFDIGIYILKNNLVTKVAKETVIHTQSQFELHQNYPNPFNGTTTIPISLDRKSSLTLTIYDILGRQIETIFKGELKAGKYTFQWSIESNRKPIESGIYFIVLQTDRNRSVRRAVYLK